MPCHLMEAANPTHDQMSAVVLLAEDEMLIRMETADALGDEGFLVIEVGNAKEALLALQNTSSSVHVLFTDIQMPGSMDGLQLAHHVRQCWPSIALIMTSGRAELASEQMPAGSRFLPKPYDHSNVVAHIREMIGIV
jgi:DNA-binding NtrC family response regulator